MNDLIQTMNIDNDLKIKMLINLIGFNEVPVSIMDFIHDEYYLGNSCGYNDLGEERTYQVWLDSLKELFPDPITMKSSFICNTGAIGCLSGDTKIALKDDRSICIKELYENKEKYIGDCVFSFKLDTQNSTYGIIDDIHYTGIKKTVRLFFRNRLGDECNVRCTLDHPFLIYSIGKYIKADELNENMIIESAYGSDWRLYKKEYCDPCDVYDLTIDKYHNYGIDTGCGDILYTHNTGKSNSAKIIILYLIYKMTCYKDFFTINDLEPNKKVLIGVSHNLKETAQKVIGELESMMDASPFFREQLADSESFINKYIEIRACKSKDDFVGENMAIWWGTELNDYKPQSRALELVTAATSRLESRYLPSFNKCCAVILDSSDRGVDSAVPIFLKENPYGRQAVNFKYAHWEAKPNQYWHKPDKDRIDKYEYLYDPRGKKYKNENYGKPALSFRLYCGDSEIHPFILNGYESNELLEKLDPDRFVDVPNELRNAFEADIELAMQEKIGKATEVSSQYFNPRFITPAFTIENLVHKKYVESSEEIIAVSFFDETDQYYDYLEEAIELIPKNRACFFGLDLALTGDYAGCCIGYIKDVGEKNVDGIVTYDPEIEIPIAFGISRTGTEETSIQKIINLIKWVHQKRTIHTVTTDRMQSYAIEQACATMKINHKFKNIERHVIAPWKYLKDLLYRNKIKFVKNQVLKTEMLNVYYDEELDKVEHHLKKNASNEIGSDSKDILDAVVRLCWVASEAVTEDIDHVISPDIVSNSRWEEYSQEYSNELAKQNMLRRIRTMMNNRRH